MSAPLGAPGCNYNLAHVISPVPYAVVARGLAGRTDFFRLRACAHRIFARTSPNPPPRRIDRRPLARRVALYGHRFRSRFSDRVHALQPDGRWKCAAAGGAAPSDRAYAAADRGLAVRHFPEDARYSRRGWRYR